MVSVSYDPSLTFLGLVTFPKWGEMKPELDIPRCFMGLKLQSILVPPEWDIEDPVVIISFLKLRVLVDFVTGLWALTGLKVLDMFK